MLANILPVIRKELRSYFNSPIAYVVMVTFVLFCSIWVFYLQTFFAADTASLRSLFGIVPLGLHHHHAGHHHAQLGRGEEDGHHGGAAHPALPGEPPWCWASSWRPCCCWPSWSA